MVNISKKSLFLLALVLTADSALTGSNLSIYKLNESDIQVAKSELEQVAQRSKILRYSLLAAGVSLAGTLLFKTWQNRGKEATADSSKSFENLGLAEKVQNVHERILKLENLDPINQSYAEKIKSFVVFNAPVLLLQQGLIRAETIFNGASLRSLLGRMDIEKHFKRLKIAQIQLDPQVFAGNINHQSDPKLCAYAREVALNFSKMTATQISELRAEAQLVLVEELNHIIKQMAQVVAYARYMVKNKTMQSILDNCANQLYLITYDAACKMETALLSHDTHELFNTIALLQSTFNITINNVLAFS